MSEPVSGEAADAVDRWDRIFEILAAEPRRQIVDALLDAPAGESVPLPEVATNPSIDTDLERVRLRLRHHHLPLLERERIVEWEREPLRAYRGCNFEDAGLVLQSLYANAGALPDRLALGCRTLERERRGGDRGSELSG
ncbi:hypothetical protein NP511_00150 [Natrinema thermotolerans]|uniref:Uncharacterized protein n=1 Tax=Natrinema thermotolerans TaxID=121872 RepID=A0AAF0PDZ7_9EURY|nr:hypothetical protein [Natrinema thermotolerans]QCC60404.1 hypothetical protein DVR14_17900 [Natrinema thermotolerans]QCC61311.1 hypothetical protein DVR14_22030 [Natrinema thermotolerans]WMT07430.1 hypothetical protein NP511_18865 [Natrinema thermotolerans]WMT08062.1 hypothetical protein NP511_00150 [Natrinema thermotolerans]